MIYNGKIYDCIKYFSQNTLVCKCGNRFKLTSLSKHLTTKKHLDYIEFVKNEVNN